MHDPKLFQLLAGRTEKIEHATQLYDYLLRPTTAKHEFADVVFRNFNVPMGGGPGERADFLQRLAPVLRKQVEEQGLADVYEKIDLPLAAVLAEVERAGIRVDPQALAKMSESMEKEVRRLEKEIWELAGSEFNVNSPTQLAEILFDKLNLQPPGTARQGQSAFHCRGHSGRTRQPAPASRKGHRVSRNREAEIHLRGHAAETNSSGNGAACTPVFPRREPPPAASAPAIRICKIFRFARNWAAKFAPRLLPKRGRSCFPPIIRRSNCASWPISPRIPCWSRPSAMAKTFMRARRRKFSALARLAQTADHRRAAKAINFGIIYGLSAFGLAKQLGIEQREAAQFINAYFTRYRGVKEYLDNILVETRKTGVAKTLFGRIRPITEINAPQMQLRNFAERTALNSPLQGTAADLIKLAMISIDERLRKKNSPRG